MARLKDMEADKRNWGLEKERYEDRVSEDLMRHYTHRDHTHFFSCTDIAHSC